MRELIRKGGQRRVLLAGEAPEGRSYECQPSAKPGPNGRTSQAAAAAPDQRNYMPFQGRVIVGLTFAGTLAQDERDFPN